MIPIILSLLGYESKVLVRSNTLQKQAKMSLEKINDSMTYLAWTFNVGEV